MYINHNPIPLPTSSKGRKNILRHEFAFESLNRTGCGELWRFFPPGFYRLKFHKWMHRMKCRYFLVKQYFDTTNLWGNCWISWNSLMLSVGPQGNSGKLFVFFFNFSIEPYRGQTSWRYIFNELCWELKNNENTTDLGIGNPQGSTSLIGSIRSIGSIDHWSKVFLGDFVDRGAYSFLGIEKLVRFFLFFFRIPASLNTELRCDVVSLLFALKVLYPSKIFLVRGNHEAWRCSELQIAHHFFFPLHWFHCLKPGSVDRIVWWTWIMVSMRIVQGGHRSCDWCQPCPLCRVWQTALTSCEEVWSRWRWYVGTHLSQLLM